MKILVTVKTDKVGSTCTQEVEVDEAQLPTDPEDREEALEEIAAQTRDLMMEWNWRVV